MVVSVSGKDKYLNDREMCPGEKDLGYNSLAEDCQLWYCDHAWDVTELVKISGWTYIQIKKKKEKIPKHILRLKKNKKSQISTM